MRHLLILALFFIVPISNIGTSAQNSTPTNRMRILIQKDKKNNDRPRCPSKPVMCLYGSNFVTIELPPDVIFAEIEISSDNNIIISGNITQDYPTLNFAELTGNYTIVLNTHSYNSTITTYIGELIF